MYNIAILSHLVCMNNKRAWKKESVVQNKKNVARDTLEQVN